MFFTPLSKRASRFLGAFLLLLTLGSCEKTEQAAFPGESVAEETAAHQSGENPTPPPSSQARPPAPADAGDSQEQSPSSLRFIAYNVENWLTMDRYIDGKRQKSKAKPDEEKEAIVAILVRHQPDVIGLCEIGSKEDLTDLQSRLKEAGLDLPHSHHTGGFDPVRRLAILSRLPIVSTELREELEYELEGKTMGMSRGILDATVKTPVGPVRLLGVHLKSKREVPEADQEMMRRSEAHLLREHATSILKEDPAAQLIVYGDFNDTRQSSAIRTIRGPRKTPLSLGMSFLRDSRGETWTHNWEYQDVYSRFDYVFFSQPVLDLVDWDSCRVLDDPETLTGSDHRALLFVLK